MLSFEKKNIPQYLNILFRLNKGLESKGSRLLKKPTL